MESSNRDYVYVGGWPGIERHRPWLCALTGPGISKTQKVRSIPQTQIFLGERANTRLGAEREQDEPRVNTARNRMN